MDYSWRYYLPDRAKSKRGWPQGRQPACPYAGERSPEAMMLFGNQGQALLVTGAHWIPGHRPPAPGKTANPWGCALRPPGAGRL